MKYKIQRRGLKIRAGVSEIIGKKGKNAAGFTIVEIMVVMSIVALLSVLGISALIGISNRSVLDRDTESLLDIIREAQNKAISVSKTPAGGVMPAAWGVKVDSGAKSVTPFYVEKNPSGLGYAYNSLSSSITFTHLSSLGVPSDASSMYFIYTVPFGSFYATDVSSVFWTWRENEQRPRDIILTSTGVGVTTVTLDYRGKKRTVTVAKNGDVYAQ